MVTFQVLVDRYLDHASVNGRHCAEARLERETTLRKFCAWTPDAEQFTLGEHAVSDLKPHHLDDWIASNRRWKSSSTRKCKSNTVHAVANWAVQSGRIDRNPFRGSEKYEEAEPRVPMPDDALERIMAASNKRFERAIMFLRLTACRLSDMFRLELEHIEWDRCRAVLPKHKSRKKTRKPKPIFLLPETIQLLRKVIAEDGITSGIVFRNNRGLPWTRRALGDYLRKLKVRLGLKCPATLHGIRHQAATVAVRNGAPMKYVSLFLGHASLAITDRYYAHVADDDEQIRQAAGMAQPKPRDGKADNSGWVDV